MLVLEHWVQYVSAPDNDILPQARRTDKWISLIPLVMSKLEFSESKLSRSALEHLLRETIV